MVSDPSASHGLYPYRPLRTEALSLARSNQV